MQRLASFLMAFVVISSSGFAQLPPIIDRELIIGDPGLSGAQISPDGKYLSFLKPLNGVRNIWVKELEEPFDQAWPITADSARPILSYVWSRNGQYVIYVLDNEGDENDRIFVVDPRGPRTPVPLSRRLTPPENVCAQLIDVPAHMPDEIIVALNDRRADLHDLYRLNIISGNRTLLYKDDQNIIGWTIDLQGRLRLGTRLTPDGGREIVRLDSGAVRSIYAVGAKESCTPVRFTPDGNKFYLETNRDRDRLALELFDMSTHQSTLVDADPLNEVDLDEPLFSEENGELLATCYTGDKRRMYPQQKRFGNDWAALTKAVPSGEIRILSRTADENVWVVSVSSDVDQGSCYLYDRRSGSTALLFKNNPVLPSSALATMKPVRYKSRDGLIIPAYLVLPKGVPARNLPSIILVHGGPWTRARWGYDPEAQFFANRGYAVLIPNYRGSTGYGKRFLNAGNKEWGKGLMQQDITEGVRYLINQKIADPRRVGIYGTTYGGYAALAGLAFTPNLFAAGVSFNGPSNLITMLRSIPPYWAPIRKLFSIRVGDVYDPADRIMLQQQSPLNAVQKIKSPLLVLRGANDPRVSGAESERTVVALHDLGRPVRYLVAPNEGKTFLGRLNRLAAYTAIEKFFATYLHGRSQGAVTPEIQGRLDKLTVDIQTVHLAAKGADARTLDVLAFDASLLKEDSLRYVGKMWMTGRETRVLTTRVIRFLDEGKEKLWRIVETTTSDMGTGNDTLDIDATSLLPVRRFGRQSPALIRLAFTADSITGAVILGTTILPVRHMLDQPTLPDGAGLEILLGTLPFVEGYMTPIAVFDLLDGVTPMILSVAGSERVVIGTRVFDALRIDMSNPRNPARAQRFWYAKDTRRLVKYEARLPTSMGGGIITSELQQ